jgi:small subunit ribosomal protein S10
MQSNKIRIRLKSYDIRLLDRSTQEIAMAAEKSGSIIIGPIPLPVKITKYTVLKSPFVDKKSREQFEKRIYKRLLDIVNPTQHTLEALMELELSAGVDVEIKN